MILSVWRKEAFMPQRDYAFGFHDDIAPLYSTGKGLTEAVVREISAIKKEPQWMLDYRLKANIQII